MTNIVQIPDEVRWDVNRPTNELRWVLRWESTGPQPMDIKPEKVLQQRWMLQSIVNDIVIEAKYEWRDVPLALEGE